MEATNQTNNHKPRTLIMEVYPHEGYSATQIEKRGRVTVGELRAALEDWDDDDEIITQDPTNRYGAEFGQLTLVIQEALLGDDEEGA